jgi:hypothetical protein
LICLIQNTNMTNNLRTTNNNFLNNWFPLLAHRIAHRQIDSGNLHPAIVASKAGVPTLSVSSGERTVFLHSQYDPIKEAQRWAASQAPPDDAVVLIFGWGMGYHVLEWVKQHGGSVEAIIIFEPEAALFDASLDHVDLQQLACAKRLEIIAGCDAQCFGQTFQNLIELLLPRDVSILPLPFASVYPKNATDFLRGEIQKLLDRKAGILRHMAEMGVMCQENIVRNIPAMVDAKFPGRVKGMAANQPAIIAAAGPSLDNNIKQLHRAYGKAWIFAVDTSLRILLSHDIEPNFVVSKDPSQRNRAHFEGLSEIDSTTLVFDPQIASDIALKFSGPKIVMPNRNHALHQYIAGLETGADDPLPHSTNVALTAFNMATHMGCNPIIFVGLDFCFAKDGGASHATDAALLSETSYTSSSQQLTYKRGDAADQVQAIEVEGIDGELYPTSPNFHESLRLLESLIGQSRRRCIDASEGGARITGTEVMPLMDTINTYCSTPIDGASFTADTSTPRKCKRIKASLNDIANHLTQCGNAAQTALADLSSLDADNPDVTLPDSVLKARAEIERGYRLYHELQSALERLLVDVSRPAFWETASQKPTEWLPRLIGYFTQIKELCDHFGELYQQVSTDIRLSGE